MRPRPRHTEPLAEVAAPAHRASNDEADLRFTGVQIVIPPPSAAYLPAA